MNRFAVEPQQAAAQGEANRSENFLGQVKAELSEIIGDFAAISSEQPGQDYVPALLSEVWRLFEKRLKESYHNGRNANQRMAKKRAAAR